MKKILLSAVSVFLAGTVAVAATAAVLTSQARVDNNMFTTAAGALQVRINGSASIPGFIVDNAHPGTCQDGQFVVQNFGSPNFAGPSTMPASVLTLSAVQEVGTNSLFSDLHIDVTASRTGESPSSMNVYAGSLSGLTSANLLHPNWNTLSVGQSETIHYNVCLPENAPASSMGQSTTFDFVVDAQTAE